MPLSLPRSVRLRAAASMAMVMLAAASSPVAHADDPYLSEVRLFALDYCPRDWLPAQGASLAVAQNTALFSLLGTTYGGDGKAAFNLPDLRGRVPVGAGASAAGATPTGLSTITQGDSSGAESHWLNTNEMPAHHHAQIASPDAATQAAPANGRILAQAQNAGIYRNGGTADVPMKTSPAGNIQPINLRNPFLGMTWCVALTGVFPSRY